MTHVTIPSVLPSQTVSDCQEMQCLRRPQEVVESVRFLSTLDQSRRYFPETRQSLCTHTFQICENPQGNPPPNAAERCETWGFHPCVLRSSLFWNVTQLRFVIGYRRFESLSNSPSEIKQQKKGSSLSNGTNKLSRNVCSHLPTYDA
jgi:hypothetical protein